LGCGKVKSSIPEKLRNYYSYMNSIVVMPDFFVDRIIKLKSKEHLCNALTDKGKFGGGSVRDVPSVDIIGGNAVNIAYCIAKLGGKVTLFTVADEIGSIMLRQTFSKFGDNTSLIIANGRQGRTTAFEFLNEKGSKVNVMVSDVGDNIDFGPDRINSEDQIKILKNADAAVVVNWASNLKGTQLAEHVFKNSAKALHFIDPADIQARKQEFLDSLSKIADITDVLSINENECNSLGGAFGLDSCLISENDYGVDSIKEAAMKLAQKTGISIDLHTRKGAAWSNGKETVFVNAIKVEVNRLTGAGDSWDAADIIGYLAGMDTNERLTFSNACVSLYIRNPYGEPPTMTQAFELLERTC
jgi:ribokinase